MAGGLPSYENFMGDIGPNTQHAINWFNWAQQNPGYNQYLQPAEWDYLRNTLLSAVNKDPYYGGLGTSYTSQYKYNNEPLWSGGTVPAVGLAQAVDQYIGQKQAGQIPNINLNAFTSQQGRGEGFRGDSGGFWDNLMSGGGWGGLGGTLLSLGLAPFTGGASLAFMPAMATLGGGIQGGINSEDFMGGLKGALTGLGIGGVGAGLAGALGLVGAGGAGTTGALTLGGKPGWGGLLSGLGGYTSSIPGFGAGGMLSGFNPFANSLPAFNTSSLTGIGNVFGASNYNFPAGTGLASGIPGGDAISNTINPTNAGGSSMNSGFFNLADLFKNKKLTDFIPSAISLMSLLGTEQPSMPNIPNTQWPLASTQDVQSALGNYQNLQQPLQDWQYQQFLKQLRPVAAQQGWLDSTYYANMLSDYLQQQNALTNAQIPSILGQQYQTQTGMAQQAYEAQLNNYLLQMMQRQKLQEALGQSIGNLLNPISEGDMLLKLLRG